MRTEGDGTFLFRGHFDDTTDRWLFRYVVERTTSEIKIWFWERNDKSVPKDVKTPGSTISTVNWRTPSAYFPDSECDIASHFGEHQIIINLTFCKWHTHLHKFDQGLCVYSVGGDWAGNAFGGGQSNCTGQSTIRIPVESGWQSWFRLCQQQPESLWKCLLWIWLAQHLLMSHAQFLYLFHDCNL